MRKLTLILCLIMATLLGAPFLFSCDKPCTVELDIQLNARGTGYTVKGIKDCGCTLVEIPEMVEDLPVVEIATSAFKDNQTIKEVVIPNTVTKICQSAFENCAELEKVTFSEQSALTRINKYAFKSCKKLAQINIPDKVTRIEYGAFIYCESLVKIILPENLKTISQFCFAYNYQLEEIVLPKNLEIIDYYAFNECVRLEKIVYPNTSENWGKVVLNEYWNRSVPASSIFCDGLVDIV